LRINDDPTFLTELRSLIAELRRLNDLLATDSVSKGKASEKVLHIAKHFDTFLGSYAREMGKGLAWLTIGTVVGLLSQTDVGKEFIDHIWAHAPKFAD